MMFVRAVALAAAIALGAAACATRSADPALTAPPPVPPTRLRLPMPISTDMAGTVPLSSVGVKPVCAEEYMFCVDFPYAEAPFSQYRAEVSTPSAGMAWAPYTMFSVHFDWTHLNGEFRLCAPEDKACTPDDMINNGGFFDDYSIYVTTEQSEDDECRTYQEGQTESVDFAGVTAVRSTCAYVRPSQGSQTIVSFAHGGLFYTLTASNTRIEPFFARQFFESFRLT